MSNLNNTYTSCPGLMSDGRSQTTDYRSHNEILKEMKGSTEQSYAFREKLQGSGLRDLEAGVRFNLCGKVPAGDIILPSTINLNITKGNYLDAFAPLSKNSFFIKPVTPQVVSSQPTTQSVMPLPATTPAPTAPALSMIPTTMAPVVTTMTPIPTTMAQPMMTTMAPVPTTMAQAMMTTMAPVPTTMAQSMMTTMAPIPTTMAPVVTTMAQPMMTTTA